MPELPEVETIKRILEKEIEGRTIKEAHLLYPRLIQTDKDTFLKDIVDKKIISLSRKGKYLIIHLSEDQALLVHFRMEGKLFHVSDLKGNLDKHVSIWFLLDDGSYLIFNDTRKFGVMYLYKEEELKECPPLAELGLEPWDIPSPAYLLEAYKHKSYMLKEAMLDQKVIAGLGNIYADEVLFASRLNPFRLANTLTKDEAQEVIKNAVAILQRAIVEGGSTIRSYHPSKGTSGKMQQELMAYGREGKECLVCGTKIQKRYVGGRGTSYCPKCQHVCPTVALTGKIASGKTEVLKLFKELGCATASADEIVHTLYANAAFVGKLQKKFPSVVTDEAVNKSMIIDLMTADKKFRRSFQTFVWAEVKDWINGFIIKNSNKVTVVEVPLLFDAKMEKEFTYLVGVETDKQIEYLTKRHDSNIEGRLRFNAVNSYDVNRKKLNFIIVNNAGRDELISQVKDIYSKLNQE